MANPDIIATDDEGNEKTDTDVEVNGIVPGDGSGGGGDGSFSGSHDDLTDVSKGDHRTDEQIQDLIDTLLSAGANLSITYDDANNTLTIDVQSDIDVGSVSLDGNTAMSAVVASGQVTLSSGAATVDTGLSATDATFIPGFGIDDPAADAKVACRLFWDDSAGTYKIEIVEDGTSVGNPTVNYDIVRVR